MKRGIVAVLGLAFAVLLGFGLLGSSNNVSANHVVAPDEITLALVGSPLIPVGSDATLTLSVTTSTTPMKSIQWELAYGANLSWAAAGSSAVYNCTNVSGINFPSETDTAPVEAVLIPAVVTQLGGGSNCASLSGPFTGAAMTGTFVTVKLRCLAAGNTFVSMQPQNQPANPANDVNFGTTLGDAGGNNIPTVLENQLAIPGFGNQAAVGIACATPVDYSVTKTATASVTGDAGAASLITTTISIHNPDGAAHPTVLVDNLPGGVTGLVVPAGCLQTGPSQVTCGYPVNGNVPTAANSTDSYIITYHAITSQECGSLSNTVSGGPGDSSTADANPANNVATAVTAVDCPGLTVTKNCVDDNGPPAFTDDTITCSVNVANNPGSTANNVVLNDVLTGGETVVSATAPCAGLFPCNLGNIVGGGSVSVTINGKLPSTAGTACDTATASQNAPGTGASSAQVCFDVKNKFPTINGIAKDTGVTPTLPDGSLDTNFQFTVGNIFLCKPLGSPNANLPAPGAFSGAGESACGVFKLAEIGQAPTGTDTCNDDDDADGKPCAGNPANPRDPYQAAGDLCQNVATDYMPGQTAVDCDTNAPGTINNTGEGAEGLGAFEFQVKFDDKLFTSPTFSCTVAPDGSPAVLGSTGRYVAAQVSIITENWVQFGCISKNHAPGQPGLPVVPGADITNAAVLGTLTVTVQGDLFSRMRPAKDNGVSTNLLDENCEFADILGQPYNLGLGTYGENHAPSGGLTNDCKDAALTIRMLEGDIDLNCTVDINDDQGIAFRYGQFFGQLNYNRFFDIEPGISPDFDIDIKDVQTVFGRNGSTCAAPIPAQPPLTTIPDP